MSSNGHKTLPLFDPPSSYELLAEFTVHGQPARKSNSRRIVKGRAGKPLIIKSAEALNYEQVFLAQVPAELRGLKLGSKDDPLLLWAHLFYASNRPDLSSEMIMDLLQKAEVISNDRFLKSQVLFGGVDKDDPRALLRLYRVRS